MRVPKHQIVGQRGQGWQVANAILGHERGSLATPDAAMNRLNGVKRLMREESINGEPIMSNPVFRDRLMKLEGRVLAMQYNDMRLLSAKINRNQDVRLAGMIVKLIGTELRHEIECLGIDVMGEIGLSYGDNPHVRGHGSWQYQYMFYLGLIIGGGTSQIQKNIISERGLGMPKEPKIPSEKSADENQLRRPEMEFGLSQDQLMLDDSVRKFLASDVPLDKVRQLAAGETDDSSVWQGLADMGLAGLIIPEAHGGAELGMLDAVAIAEAWVTPLAPVRF